MYIATTYIGTDYMPGETLPDSLPQEFIERLLKSGAVQSAAPNDMAAAPVEPANPQEEDMPDDEPHGSGMADVEIVEEEVPEIDVMDGIVRDKPAPARKSRAERSRKAPKGGKTE